MVLDGKSFHKQQYAEHMLLLLYSNNLTILYSLKVIKICLPFSIATFYTFLFLLKN